MDKFMSIESDSSEDEVFPGKRVGAREIRRCVKLGRRTISVVSLSDESEDATVELIEAQSEPELMQDSPSPEKPREPRRSRSQPDLRESLAPNVWESKVTDESFLAMENLTTVDNSAFNDQLDTILDRKENILNVIEHEKEENITMRKYDGNSTSKSKECDSVQIKPDIKTSLFKTPLKPNKLKVPRSGTKMTPNRSPMRGPSPFCNIDSPVGFYIKHSPQALLVQTVRPKRPLPGMSAIPKLMDHPGKPRDKENVSVNLPSKAYMCAKQTKLIVTPDLKRLPKNNQVKKMASALPHPTVMRHERREKLPVARPDLQTIRDESFARLSLSQADLSVCVVKSVAMTDTLKRNKRE